MAAWTKKGEVKPLPEDKPLTHRERAIINGIIACKPKTQIARELNIAASTVYHTIYRPHIKKYMKKIHDTTEQKQLAATDKYNDLVFEALEIAEDLMLSAEKDADKLKALDLILKGAPMMRQTIKVEIKQQESLAATALKSLTEMGLITPEIDGTLPDLEEIARIEREAKLKAVE